jgi:hypothetical protein
VFLGINWSPLPSIDVAPDGHAEAAYPRHGAPREQRLEGLRRVLRDARTRTLFCEVN